MVSASIGINAGVANDACIAFDIESSIQINTIDIISEVVTDVCDCVGLSVDLLALQ